MSDQRSPQDIAAARSLARHFRNRPGLLATAPPVATPERLTLRSALAEALLLGHLTRAEALAILDEQDEPMVEVTYNEDTDTYGVVMGGIRQAAGLTDLAASELAEKMRRARR